MKKPKLFDRLTAASLALLLLLLATAGKSIESYKAVAKKPSAEQSAKQDSKEPVIVQELSLEAVVAPAISFDFQQDFYFLPQVCLVELIRSSTTKQFDVFYYFFSFFRNVFGHYIAINAP